MLKACVHTCASAAAAAARQDVLRYGIHFARAILPLSNLTLHAKSQACVETMRATNIFKVTMHTYTHTPADLVALLKRDPHAKLSRHDDSCAPPPL
jgi:hypothetical protein